MPRLFPLLHARVFTTHSHASQVDSDGDEHAEVELNRKVDVVIRN